MKIYQTLETVFHRLSEHHEFRQKYFAARRIFNSLLGVWISRWNSVSCVWYITSCQQSGFQLSVRQVIGSVFTTLHDWIKKFAPLFHPIRNKTKPNRDSPRFPRFASATCDCVEFWLVHCIICVLSDWLEWLLWFWFYDTQLKTNPKQRKIEHSMRHLPSLSVADTVQEPQGMETLALKFKLVVFISRWGSHIKKIGMLIVLFIVKLNMTEDNGFLNNWYLF